MIRCSALSWRPCLHQKWYHTDCIHWQISFCARFPGRRQPFIRCTHSPSTDTTHSRVERAVLWHNGPMEQIDSLRSRYLLQHKKLPQWKAIPYGTLPCTYCTEQSLLHHWSNHSPAHMYPLDFICQHKTNRPTDSPSIDTRPEL